MHNLTWACHVCGRVRPDHFISVYKGTRYINGIRVETNTRYCNDNRDCFLRAPQVFGGNETKGSR